MNPIRMISLLSSKTFRHKTELRQDRYLSIRKLLKLLSFATLPQYLLFCRPFSGAEDLWISRVSLLDTQESTYPKTVSFYTHF